MKTKSHEINISVSCLSGIRIGAVKVKQGLVSF